MSRIYEASLPLQETTAEVPSMKHALSTPPRLSSLRRFASTWIAPSTVVELLAIVIWALYVGREFLNLDPNVMPVGNEFGMAIQPHFVWTLFSECGSCVFWNGFVNGGNPAFVELHGVVLHPIVVITTMLWGGVNGAKLALIASFAMAGVAQWWLARVLSLGLSARIWSAAMAVTAGHLAGRLNLGVFGVVLSTASCSLIIAPALHLALHGRRRMAVLLSVVLALAIVSGQGYLQLGVVFALLPAFLVMLLDNRVRLRPVWKEFAIAGGLALLLSGIFLVPLLHFWPNFAKEIDPAFGSVQPLEYVPLNLVIRDVPFYITENILFKQPYPYLYVNYISWVPIFLAVIAIRLVPRRQLRVLLFFIVAIGLVYVASSGGLVGALARLVPTFAAGVRNPPLIAGLAVPLILALAAWGLDLLLKIRWPALSLAISSVAGLRSLLGLRADWLLMALPLLWALRSTYDFSQTWLRTKPFEPGVAQVIQALVPPTTAWVEPPFGEHFWTPPSITAGLKITTVVRPWAWKDRPAPPPYLRASRFKEDAALAGFVKEVGEIVLLASPDNQYAFINTGTQNIPCQAQAIGGNIDVACDTPVTGQLIVQENNWSGWSAKRDGTSVALAPGRWLSVPAPAGQHHYTFRYRPWDVLLGGALTLLGLGALVWLWRGAAELPPEQAGPFDGEHDRDRSDGHSTEVYRANAVGTGEE